MDVLLFYAYASRIYVCRVVAWQWYRRHSIKLQDLLQEVEIVSSVIPWPLRLCIYYPSYSQAREFAVPTGAKTHYILCRNW
jgi:hypothetical protein